MFRKGSQIRQKQRPKVAESRGCFSNQKKMLGLHSGYIVRDGER